MKSLVHDVDREGKYILALPPSLWKRGANRPREITYGKLIRVSPDTSQAPCKDVKLAGRGKTGLCRALSSAEA